MITDLILLVFYGVINVLLLPVTAFNIVVDFWSSIPVVTEFLQIGAYIIPWSNVLPLIILLLAIFTFKTLLALVKAVVYFIPFF